MVAIKQKSVSAYISSRRMRAGCNLSCIREAGNRVRYSSVGTHAGTKQENSSVCTHLRTEPYGYRDFSATPIPCWDRARRLQRRSYGIASHTTVPVLIERGLALALRSSKDNPRRS